MGNFKNVFVVTYGRSGSTLLLGLLNAIPGYLIRGENNNMTGVAQTFFKKLPRFDHFEQVEKTPPTNPWFGYENYRDDVYKKGIRRFFDTILLENTTPGQVRCYGFKEIRYTPDNVAEKVDFIRSLYPEAAFILNARKPEDVVKSEVSSGFDKTTSIDYLERFNATFAQMAEGDDCFLIHYEDIVGCNETFRNLYKFLGENFVESDIRNVLRVKHSYHRDIEGSIYSNFPFFIEQDKSMNGVSLFIVDRLRRFADRIYIGGVFVQRTGGSHMEFARVVNDETGASCAARIANGLSSPNVASKLKRPDAKNARFEVEFASNGGSSFSVRANTDDVLIRIKHADQL